MLINHFGAGVQNTSDLFNSLLHGGYASQGGQQLFTPLSLGINTVPNNLMMAAYIIQEIAKANWCLFPHRTIQSEIVVDKKNVSLSRASLTARRDLAPMILTFVTSNAPSLFSLQRRQKFNRTVLARSCFVGGDKLAL